MLTHIDLFSGIGGFALAAQWAGFKTVVFCENESFCQKVLKARFGTIAESVSTNGRRKDSCYFTNERRQTNPIGRKGIQSKNGRSCSNNFESGNPILIPDIRDFDGRRFRGATLLTGGFPCQPFSCAGKRKGKEDSRYLWPEMLQVISEARPTWVLGENVAGIVNMELEQVCTDLEAEGYEVQPIIIPACAVNAPHRRSRVWIVASSIDNTDRTIGKQISEKDGIQKINRPSLGSGMFAGTDSHAPDTEDRKTNPAESRRLYAEFSSENSNASDSEISELNGDGRTWAGRGRPSDNGWQTSWSEVATRLCRVDDGVPRRVDRLKALGNAIVPQVAYEIIKIIARIEEVHDD